MSEDMVIFLQNIVNSLSIGGIYILIGVGFTLVFGLTHLVNFAHGQFIILGAFIAYALMSVGCPFWLAMPGSMLCVGLLAIALDLGLFRRNLDRPSNGLIISLGLVIVIEGIVVKIWGTDAYALESPLGEPWDVGGVIISQERALLLATSFVLIIALFFFLRRTDPGRAIMAVAENRTAAAILGLNVGRSITLAFFAGSAIAAAAGCLLGLIFPFTVYFGGDLLLKGIAVSLVGGLGSVEGAVLAGLMLGLAETIGSYYGIRVGSYEFGPTWRDGYAFLLMIIIITLRPQGLFQGTDPKVI